MILKIETIIRSPEEKDEYLKENKWKYKLEHDGKEFFHQRSVASRKSSQQNEVLGERERER